MVRLVCLWVRFVCLFWFSQVENMFWVRPFVADSGDWCEQISMLIVAVSEDGALRRGNRPLLQRELVQALLILEPG